MSIQNILIRAFVYFPEQITGLECDVGGRYRPPPPIAPAIADRVRRHGHGGRVLGGRKRVARRPAASNGVCSGVHVAVGQTVSGEPVKELSGIDTGRMPPAARPPMRKGEGKTVVEGASGVVDDRVVVLLMSQGE